jgi:hypothetical protein
MRVLLQQSLDHEIEDGTNPERLPQAARFGEQPEPA